MCCGIYFWIDEAGLEQEKQKVSSRVLETRRRTIQDVVSRVILDGEGAEVPAEIDPIVLLVDPTVEVKTKKIVKQMAVKFSAAPAAAGESVILLDGADRRESVDLGTASGQGSSSSDGATTVSEKSDEGAV